jgi:hypothetical protein
MARFKTPARRRREAKACRRQEAGWRRRSEELARKQLVRERNPPEPEERPAVRYYGRAGVSGYRARSKRPDEE